MEDTTQLIPLEDLPSETSLSPSKEIGHLFVLPYKGTESKSCALVDGENVVGRSSSCNVEISHKALSKKHACITYDHSNQDFFICDYNSTNKTRIGKRVLKPNIQYQITFDQKISFGDVHAYLRRPTSPAEPSDDGTSSDILLPRKQKLDFLNDSAQLVVADSQNVSIKENVSYNNNTFVPETPYQQPTKTEGRESMASYVPDSPDLNSSKNDSRLLPLSDEYEVDTDTDEGCDVSRPRVVRFSDVTQAVYTDGKSPIGYTDPTQKVDSLADEDGSPKQTVKYSMEAYDTLPGVAPTVKYTMDSEDATVNDVTQPTPSDVTDPGDVSHATPRRRLPSDSDDTDASVGATEGKPEDTKPRDTGISGDTFAENCDSSDTVGEMSENADDPAPSPAPAAAHASSLCSGGETLDAYDVSDSEDEVLIPKLVLSVSDETQSFSVKQSHASSERSEKGSLGEQKSSEEKRDTAAADVGDATVAVPNDDETMDPAQDIATVVVPNDDATAAVPNDSTVAVPNDEATMAVPNDDATVDAGQDESTVAVLEDEATVDVAHDAATLAVPYDYTATDDVTHDAATLAVPYDHEEDRRYDDAPDDVISECRHDDATLAVNFDSATTLAVDYEDSNVAASNAAHAEPDDSDTVAVPDDSETVVVPDDSETVAVPDDRQAVAVPDDTETVAVLDDTETVAVPDDSETVAVPYDDAATLAVEFDDVASTNDSTAPLVPFADATMPVDAVPNDGATVAVPSDDATVDVPNDDDATVDILCDDAAVDAGAVPNDDATMAVASDVITEKEVETDQGTADTGRESSDGQNTAAETNDDLAPTQAYGKRSPKARNQRGTRGRRKTKTTTTEPKSTASNPSKEAAPVNDDVTSTSTGRPKRNRRPTLKVLEERQDQEISAEKTETDARTMETKPEEEKVEAHAEHVGDDDEYMIETQAYAMKPESPADTSEKKMTSREADELVTGNPVTEKKDDNQTEDSHDEDSRQPRRTSRARRNTRMSGAALPQKSRRGRKTGGDSVSKSDVTDMGKEADVIAGKPEEVVQNQESAGQTRHGNNVDSDDPAAENKHHLVDDTAEEEVAEVIERPKNKRAARRKTTTNSKKHVDVLNDKADNTADEAQAEDKVAEVAEKASVKRSSRRKTAQRKPQGALTAEENTDVTADQSDAAPEVEHKLPEIVEKPSVKRPSRRTTSAKSTKQPENVDFSITDTESKADKPEIDEDQAEETTSKQTLKGKRTSRRKTTACTVTIENEDMEPPPKRPNRRATSASATSKAKSVVDDADDAFSSDVSQGSATSTTDKPANPRKRGISSDRSSTSESPRRQSRRLELNLSQTSDVTPCVLFTGVDDKYSKMVESLGGRLAQGVADCTHLVTDKLRRTVKLLCCMGRGIYIVDVSWLNQCKKANRFIDAAGYLVNDKATEQQHNFVLKDSLQRASETRLFTGHRIHVTPSVKPPPKDMEEIIRCCGGEYLPAVPRTAEPHTVVVGHPDDKRQCGAALKAGVPVVTAEFILTGILRQQVDPEAFLIEEYCDTKNEKPTEKQKPAARVKRKR